jgi:hypothetical protein
MMFPARIEARTQTGVRERQTDEGSHRGEAGQAFRAFGAEPPAVRTLHSLAVVKNAQDESLECRELAGLFTAPHLCPEADVVERRDDTRRKQAGFNALTKQTAANVYARRISKISSWWKNCVPEGTTEGVAAAKK